MILVDGRREENLHFKWFPNPRPIAYMHSGRRIEIIVPDSST